VAIDKLLNPGERVVISTRTHIKVLFGTILILLVTVFATGFLAAQIGKKLDSGGLRTTAYIVLAVVAVIVLVRWVLRPFLMWLTSRYIFTDRRFIQRSGLIAKEGHTIPLNRIAGVDFEMGVLDRLFGCGTLIVSDASDERVPLKDIPHVERVQKAVAEELHQVGQGGRRTDDGT
jgi:uncharacterized membrane protein YdbT with pleckstrin-like domain